jgi:uncharacterized protein YjbJ (UPF0337 family)
MPNWRKHLTPTASIVDCCIRRSGAQRKTISPQVLRRSSDVLSSRLRDSQPRRHESLLPPAAKGPLGNDKSPTSIRRQNSSRNDRGVAEFAPHGATVIGGARRAKPDQRKGSMDWKRIQDDWPHFKHKARENWVKLTADDVAWIDGRREALIGRLQEHYGFAAAEAEREVEAWARTQKQWA